MFANLKREINELQTNGVDIEIGGEKKRISLYYLLQGII